jgi:hypothetical protein
MDAPSIWLPMRWPCGTLEIVRREKAKGLTPKIREVLQRWQDPNLLSLVTGTPINCLVIPWAAGLPEDAQHQHDLLPLVRACRQAGVSLVGTVDSPADIPATVDSAKAVGLSALAMETVPREVTTLPIIPWADRAKIPWDGRESVVALTKGVWPGIRGNLSSPEAGAEAGPTGVPWVDSNGWLIQLVRTQGPQRKIWMALDSPEEDRPLRGESYVLAVADSAAFGAQWVVSLDDHFRAGLAQEDPAAKNSWKKILHALSFFQRHQDWLSFTTGGVLGIVSDFSGDNELLSEEVLNLACRRQLQFRVILKARCSEKSLAGLKAVLYVDLQPPETKLRGQLLKFVEAGGLLITTPVWGKKDGVVLSESFDGNYLLFQSGRGRLAVAREVPQDPFELAAEVQLLLSRRNDLIRVGNGFALICFYSVDLKTGHGLAQMVDYSGWVSTEAVSIWMNCSNGGGKFWNLTSDLPANLRGTRTGNGVEFYLPRFPIYAAIEVGG